MKDLKGKKILVIGGAGFIGSHLVSALLESQAKVFVIDREILPQSIFALQNLSKKVNLSFIDIRERNKILQFFKRTEIDYVFNFAGESIISECYKDPYKTFESNIMGTVNMLEAIRLTNRVEGIILASTDKAYGRSDKAYTEDFPLKGDHPYDVSKSSADLISYTYFRSYGLPVVIARFGNVYGEGDLHFNTLIPGICEAIIKNKTFEIRSDGTFVRDYMYIKDLISGYMTLLHNSDKTRGEAYNFSSKDNLSVLEVIKKASKVIGKKLPYSIMNNSKNEIPYQHLDDRKVKKLGWKPEYSLDIIFKPLIEWYRRIM